MTLIEELNKLDEKEIVSIGSCSGYIDIGYAEEMRKPEYLEALSKRERDKFAESVKRAKIDMMAALKKLPFLKKEEPSASEAERYLDELRSYIGRCEKALSTLNKATRKLANFTDLATRNVKDVYPRIWENDGTCIKIEGDESGGYWSIKEKFGEKGDR